MRPGREFEGFVSHRFQGVEFLTPPLNHKESRFTRAWMERGPWRGEVDQKEGVWQSQEELEKMGQLKWEYGDEESQYEPF